MEFDFQRYLDAKRTVDDRALNRHVWRRLENNFKPGSRILEVACGTGSMLRRMREWGLTIAGSSYLGLDSDFSNISQAKQAFSAADIRFEHGDVFERVGENEFDLLIAAAFLDLVDLETALPHLSTFLAPGGLAYFPVNFDGITVFEPSRPRDDVVLTAYHDSMDSRPSGGNSRTGRLLFAALRNAGFEMLAAGASDWVVYAGANGEYPADEGYFLDHILYFFEQSCAGVDGVAEWLADRRAQISAGELVYIAHQLDFLVRKPG